MKASVMNKVVMSVFAMALVSCGSAKGTNGVVKSEVATTQMLSCAMSYEDSSIQKDPVFTKSFELVWPLKEGKESHIEMYGVTPDTNDYYAAIAQNGNDVNQLALQIGRNSTHGHNGAIFEVNTSSKPMMIWNQINSKQSFFLMCSKK